MFDSDDDTSGHHIHGRVTDARGKGIPDAEVIVWWKRLRTQVQVATGRTSDDGNYRLGYEIPRDAPAQPLVFVEARSHSLAAPLTSDWIAVAPGLAVNLQATAPANSEYTAILTAMTPLLGNVPVTDLVESRDLHDLTYLERGKDAG